MSEENVEIVRAMIDAANRGDWDATIKYAAPSFVWDNSRALGTDNPVVRYALLPVFLVFEILFYGFIVILSERTHELFPFWAVITANTLAAVCMAAYLWRRHPAFRSSIHDTPLGAAPLR